MRGLYGNRLLEAGLKEKEYDDLYDYIYIEICDADKKKADLCIKYNLEKLKPINKIINDSIKALNMQKYCKEDYDIQRTLINYTIDDWQYDGIPIASFDERKIKESLTDEDRKYGDEYSDVHEKWYSESVKLITEIRKRNTIKNIRIAIINSEHQEERGSDPAIYIGNYINGSFTMSKDFFKEFLDKYPHKEKENISLNDIENIKKLVIEKVEYYTEAIIANKEYKPYLDKIIDRAKIEVSNSKNQLKEFKKYDNVSDKDIKEENDTIRELTPVTKGKLPKIIFDCDIKNNQMNFYISKNKYSKQLFGYILSSIYRFQIMDLLKHDEDIKSRKIKILNTYEYDYEVRNKEFKDCYKNQASIFVVI